MGTEPKDMMDAVARSMAGRTDQPYAGKASLLRPLHEAVLALATDQGPDVGVPGRAARIPVVRGTQLLAVAPGPRDTPRAGPRYRQEPPADDRLAPAKGLAQATHRLHLPADAPVEQVGTLEPLVRAAYEQS